jgi:hypothetical protein
VLKGKVAPEEEVEDKCLMPNKFRKRKRVKYHAPIVVSGAYKKDSSSLGVDWLGSFYLYSRS